MELDELYEMRFNLEQRRDRFFGDDPNPHYGDRGYQDILEDLDDINEQIEELENDGC